MHGSETFNKKGRKKQLMQVNVNQITFIHLVKNLSEIIFQNKVKSTC